jgi:hypothetical protein
MSITGPFSSLKKMPRVIEILPLKHLGTESKRQKEKDLKPLKGSLHGNRKEYCAVGTIYDTLALLCNENRPDGGPVWDYRRDRS